MGALLLKFGKLHKAKLVLKEALKIKKDDTNILHNIGDIYHKQGKLKKAEETYQEAIDIKPNSSLYNNLGSVYKDMGKVEEAKKNYYLALELVPNSPAVYNNLGNLLMDQGFLGESLKNLSYALELKKDLSMAFNNFLLCSNYVYRYDDNILTPDKLFYFHRQFGEQIADRYLPYDYDLQNELIKDKPLRVGFVSPDFQTHSVSYFTESVFETLDKDNYQIYCYSEVESPDLTTLRLREHSSVWISTVGMSDDVLAK